MVSGGGVGWNGELVRVYWRMDSEEDPRWNSEGYDFVDLVTYCVGIPPGLVKRIEENVQSFGDAPRDLRCGGSLA